MLKVAYLLLFETSINDPVTTDTVFDVVRTDVAGQGTGTTAIPSMYTPKTFAAQFFRI